MGPPDSSNPHIYHDVFVGPVNGDGIFYAVQTSEDAATVSFFQPGGTRTFITGGV